MGEGGGCEARFSLTLFQTKICHFLTIFLDRASEIHVHFQTCFLESIPGRFLTFKPTWLKSIPYFRPKRLKNHTLWRRIYLYSFYWGVTPPPPPRRRNHRMSSSCSHYTLFCLRICQPWQYSTLVNKFCSKLTIVVKFVTF